MPDNNENFYKKFGTEFNGSKPVYDIINNENIFEDYCFVKNSFKLNLSHDHDSLCYDNFFNCDISSADSVEMEISQNQIEFNF